MGTSNYNLPKINGSDSVKVPRDFNKLSDAVDAILKQEIAQLTSELISLGNGSPKGVYPTLASLQTAKPNGDSNVYIVAADGKWYFWNGSWMAGGTYQATALQPNSIAGEFIPKEAINYFKHTPEVPLPFKVRPKNLFNKNKVVIGKYVKNSDGLLADNATYTASDWIPVKPNVDYTLTHRDQAAWYDASKTYISGIVASAQSPYTVQSPANAAYFRISTLNTKIATQMIEESSVLTAFEPYYTELKLSAMDYIEKGTVDETLISSAYKEKANRLLTTAEIIGKELNDPTRSVRVKLLGDSITHGMGGTGYAEDGDLIPGTAVKMNPNGYCWANNLRTLLLSKYAGYKTFAYNDQRIILKTTAYFVNASNFQFQNNTASSPLFEFKFKGDEMRVVYMSYANGGKVDVFVDGVYHSTLDSYSATLTQNVEHTVTVPYGEHTLSLRGTATKNTSSGGFLFTLLGLKFNRKITFLNYAQSGKNSSHFYTQRDTVVEIGDDIIIMQLGTNDRHNMPSTSDTKRYQRGIIETAYSKGAKVILMSSIPTTVADDNNPIRNFGMYDIDRAIRELAFEYNMTYISNYDAFLDFAEFRGINMDTLLADGLHPNDAGYDVMFRNIVRRLGIHYVRPGITK